MHTLVKIKENKPNKHGINIGYKFSGILDKNSLEVGKILSLNTTSRWFKTSEILEITDHLIDKGIKVIETQNSTYHLIPFNPSKE